MKKLSGLELTVMVLVVVGSLNWGLMALNWNWNLVDILLTNGSVLARLVYGFIGLSGLYLAYWLRQ